MKRLLTACLGLLAVATPAFAQEQQTLPAPGASDITPLIGRPLPPISGTPSVSAPAEMSQTIFRQPIYPNDSTRYDLPVPVKFTSGNEWRGIGMIYAPGKFHEFYSGSVYNETSQIYFENDQEYIDLFKGAGAWTMDTLAFFVFQDPTAFAQTSGHIIILKTSQNFYGSNPANWNGVVGARAAMTKVFDYEMNPDTLATRTTPDPENPDSYSIARTLIALDPPLSFNAGEAAVILYVNDEAPAVPIANVVANSEVQQVITNLEWKTATRSLPKTQMPDSLPWYKALGVVMFRPSAAAADTIYASGRGLQLTINDRVRAAEFGLSRSVFTGTADLTSGVKYHFGTDAKEQGITAISPNPARESATINFALKESAPVSLDIYDGSGTLVRHIVDARYVRGTYSYTLQTSDLAAGNYLVRLTAGETSYASKFSVVK